MFPPKGNTCYLGNHKSIRERGGDRAGEWSPESPVYGLARFIEEFNGVLIPDDCFDGLTGDSERVSTDELSE